MTDKEQKRKEYLKAYYQAKKDKIKAQAKAYADANKDKVKEYNKNYNKNYIKNYTETDKERIREYQREYRKNRIKTDPIYKMRITIKRSILKTLKTNGFKKLSTTELILGFSFQDFKEHLESQFEDWMTWENHGLYNGTYNYGWDIDHNIPTSSAITQDELLKLNHYTNLKPLCSKVNRYEKRDN